MITRKEEKMNNYQTTKQGKVIEVLENGYVYIHKMPCKCCHKMLTNNADLSDWDEGFICNHCGIEYNHQGKEI